MLVRASVGTLAVLGLRRIRMIARPTTAYLLQYSPRGCMASCSFCPQASGRSRMLSRVEWPEVDLSTLAERLPGSDFRRICLQTVLKPRFWEEALEILAALRESGVEIPASVATTPVPRRVLEEFRDLGVTHLGVGLDAATPELARAVGKPYPWSEYLRFVREGLRVFGRRRVVVHLIYGLGETEEEFAEALCFIYGEGAEVALFSFTPVRGTPMERRAWPDVSGYRRMQALRYLLSSGADPEEALELWREGRIEAPLESMLTSGCPDCNRPFYNERPSGPIYNYPDPSLLPREVKP